MGQETDLEISNIEMVAETTLVGKTPNIDGTQGIKEDLVVSSLPFLVISSREIIVIHKDSQKDSVKHSLQLKTSRNYMSYNGKLVK